MFTHQTPLLREPPPEISEHLFAIDRLSRAEDSRSPVQGGLPTIRRFTSENGGAG